MPTLIPDRLSLKIVRTDYWRSLTRYGTGQQDIYAVVVIFVVPAASGVIAMYPFRLVLHDPAALLPAVSLLAGVLLAAAGQVVTLRGRIADSLTLSSNKRVTMHVRETVSGILLAAVAALIDALLLGVLTVILDANTRWYHIAVTGVIIAVTVYLSLMFIITARRLYATYLEAFEDGAPLLKKRRS